MISPCTQDIVEEDDNGKDQEEITAQIKAQRGNKETTNKKEFVKEEDCNNEEQKEIEKEDQCEPKDEEKLKEGLALFSNDYGSEDESPVEEIKLTEEECSKNKYSVQNGRDSEDSTNNSVVSDEENGYEPETRRANANSGISIRSKLNSRAGARIQINSKGRN